MHSQHSHPVSDVSVTDIKSENYSQSGLKVRELGGLRPPRELLAQPPAQGEWGGRLNCQSITK